MRPAYRVAALVLLLVAVCASPQQALSVDKFFGSIWQDSQDPLFGTLFNQITPENYGKWHLVEPSDNNYQWSSLDSMFSFAAAKGLIVKEHTFVWGWAEPSWVNSANAAVAVDDWISDYMTRYTGQVDLIDVVNEPIHELPSYSPGLGGSGATGWDWLIWCYQKARQYAPDSTLILNEYFALTSDDMANQVKTLSILLKDRGLLDAIGEQGHFMEGTSAADIRRRLDLLSEVGLPIYISEYDVDVSDDQQQLSIYQSQFPVLWEHPNVRGITLWGHRQGKMWRTNAYLVRSDDSERPALTWLRGYLTSAPGTATAPFPGNGAVGAPTNASLSWGHGYAATSREVYFGTNASPGVDEYKGRQFPLSFDPGPLENAKTYYWRINEVNANGTSTGEVWSFTVGIVATVTNYTLGGTNWTAHMFMGVGTTSLVVAVDGSVEVLVVGGGGGGGGGASWFGGGGGGAGGLIAGRYSISAGTYNITIGGGGVGGTATGDAAGFGGDGGDSFFDTLLAGGGGGGGRYGQAGRAGKSPTGATVGGCAGGSGRDGSDTRSAPGIPAGNGTTTYNSAGGACYNAGGWVSAAGGGGAGGQGYNGHNDQQSLTGTYAQGGVGKSFAIAGLTNGYAGGGGGAWQTGTSVPLGGSGVGGNGNHNSADQVGGNGAVNTGSGGGGGYIGGAGGNGIVIVRYVNLSGPNLPPVAQSQMMFVVTNTPTAITLTGSDPEGSNLTYAVVSGPAHGALSGTAPNLTYTSSGSYTGADGFTFKVNDGELNSAEATVSITVTSGGGVQATGGTVTNYTLGGTNYTAHIFTTVGANSLVVMTTGKVDVLVVAGGGGGGNCGSGNNPWGGGGGGAGGVIYAESYAVAVGSYAIAVGAGGNGGSSTVDSNGGAGGNSLFGALPAAEGGGGGGGYQRVGSNGGSGGGTGRDSTSVGGTGNAGQGYAGGKSCFGVDPTWYSGAGGGGGADGSGGDGSNTYGGSGGLGISNWITGSAVAYAGGGGGVMSGTADMHGGAGGSGVGGAGGSVQGAEGLQGQDGMNARGGGGGGSFGAGNLGGRGGSGIVIVRYVTAGRVLSPYELWQQTYFTAEQLTNSAIMGDNADPDGDGMKNINEYYAGTVPTNGASVLCIVNSAFRTPSSEFVIRWQSVSDHRYTVQAATNLVNGFDPIPGASNIPATYPVNVYTDDTANVGMRFYRIRVQE